MRACLWIMLLSVLSFPGLALARAPVALPVTPSVVAAAPAAQFYVLSFTDAPIAEVAEAVVGGALSRDLVIDPAIAGTMSFAAEGAFTAEALLQEFGSATLEQDVALVRSRAGDLSLVPRSNMAAALARGSDLVALAPPGAASSLDRTAATTEATPSVYGGARWWEGPFGGLLIFLTGAVSGAGALFAGQRLLRPAGPNAPAMVRITHTAAVADDPADRERPEDHELTIPRFESRPRDGRDSRF